MRKPIVALAGVALVSLFLGGAALVTWNTPMSNIPVIGGNGGYQSDIACPADKLLVGIQVRSGALIDQIRGICKKIYLTGSTGTSWNVVWGGGSGDTYYTLPKGGTGGLSSALLCPANYGVIEIRGNARNNIVEWLQLVCSPLAVDVARGGLKYASTIKVTTPIRGGATNRGSSITAHCQIITRNQFTGQWIQLQKFFVGLRVRTGTLVDQVAPLCGSGFDYLVPGVTNVVRNPSGNVPKGTTLQIVAQLLFPAPPGGVYLQIYDHQYVTAPTRVYVPAGRTSVSFAATVHTKNVPTTGYPKAHFNVKREGHALSPKEVWISIVQ